MWGRNVLPLKPVASITLDQEPRASRIESARRTWSILTTRFVLSDISTLLLPAFGAGRSAKRLIKYGYHALPYGTYSRKRCPPSTKRRCKSRRMP